MAIIAAPALISACHPGHAEPDVTALAPTARLQYMTGFEAPLTLKPVSVHGNSNQYLSGGDVSPFTTPIDLWSTPPQHRAWVLSVVGPETAQPSSTYIENSIKAVTGRAGTATRALSLNSRMQSPDTDVQQVALQNAYMEVEPVMYQRVWVKFDTGTLDRARAIGANDFWQMFWEMKADPDYRIRLQLQYDERTGLYWQAQGDVLTDANPLWRSTLKAVPVVLASDDSAAGWHKLEIWMDRPAGRFKASVDGTLLIDHTGALTGISGSRTSQLKMAMVYGHSALGEVLFDDLEIWSAPPTDAWAR